MISAMPVLSAPCLLRALRALRGAPSASSGLSDWYAIKVPPTGAGRSLRLRVSVRKNSSKPPHAGECRWLAVLRISVNSGPGDARRKLSDRFSHRATETRRGMRARNALPATPKGASLSAAPRLRESQSPLTGLSNSDRKTGFLTEPQRHGEVLQSDVRHCS